MFKRSYYQFVSKIAILAVLFAAIAPTLAHAFPSQNTPQTLWQEICSAQGTKRIAIQDIAKANSVIDANQLAPNKQPQPNNMGMHFEHCPYCFSHAGAVGLAPPPLALFLADLNDPRLIGIYAAPVIPAYYQSTHPSRAPPSI